jgi:hypothetical protein
MEVICLETEAFYSLVEKVVDQLRAKENQPNSKWIRYEEAMELLGIKSKVTLQKLRDEGKIRYSHPEKKILLYDRESIELYLEKHAKEAF